MDIQINAPGHKHFSKLEEYYKNVLNEKYENLDFLVRAELFIGKDEKGMYEVKLILQPKRGDSLFAHEKAELEEKAFKLVLKKLRPQIEKYKGSHYHTHTGTV